MACQLAFSERTLNTVPPSRSPAKYPFPSSPSSVSKPPKVVLLPSSVLQSRADRQEQSDISLHSKAPSPHPKKLKSSKASEPCMPAISSIVKTPPIIIAPDIFRKPSSTSQEAALQGCKSHVLGCLPDPHPSVGVGLARSSPQDIQSSAQPVRKKVRFSGHSPQNNPTVGTSSSGREENGGLSGRNMDELDRRKAVHERGSQLEPVIVTVHFTHSRQAYDRSPIAVDRVFNMSLNLPPRSRTLEVPYSGHWLAESEVFKHTKSNAQSTAGPSDTKDDNTPSPSLQSVQAPVFEDAEHTVPVNTPVLSSEGGNKERKTRAQNRLDCGPEESDYCAARNRLASQGQSPPSPCSAPPSQEFTLANPMRTNCSTQENSPDSKNMSDDKNFTEEVDQKDSQLLSAQEGLCGLGNWTRADVYGSCDALDGF